MIICKIARIQLTFGAADAARWRAVNCGSLQAWHAMMGTAGNPIAGLSSSVNQDTVFPRFVPIDLAADGWPDGMIGKITLN